MEPRFNNNKSVVLNGTSNRFTVSNNILLKTRDLFSAWCAFNNLVIFDTIRLQFSYYIRSSYILIILS